MKKPAKQTKQTKAAKPKAPKKAKPKAPRHLAKGRQPVPALDVARFMSRPNGASMAELEKHFKILAHPMRAKIHYVRRKLGWTIDVHEGRYYAVEPTPESDATAKTK